MSQYILVERALIIICCVGVVQYNMPVLFVLCTVVGSLLYSYFTGNAVYCIPVVAVYVEL